VVGPAPLSTLSEKLRSPTPDVRVVALLHARAHGAAAKSLAADIARMFEDESGAVQWHAMGAFIKVGHAAEDAVPVVQAQLAKGAPPMLVSRALAALQTIGPAAHGAKADVVRLFEAAADDGLRADALQALVAIAPGDTDVRELFVAALYRPEYQTSSQAKRSLECAPEELVDYIAEVVRQRGTDGTPDERRTCGSILMSLAPKRPELVKGLIPALLDPPDGTCVSAALFAMGQLPRGDAIELVEHVVRVAQSGDATASVSAIERLDEMGEGGRALPVLVQKLDQHRDDAPLGGPEGNASRVFAAAAKLIAATPGPPVDEVLPKLIVWLRALPSRAWPTDGGPSWYTVRKVVVAAARLAPSAPEVPQVLLDVAAESRKWLESDESGVMDFERSLDEALHLMGDPPALWKKLEALGVERAHATGEPDEETESELPDFPPEARAPKPKELKALPLPAEQRRRVDEAVSVGETIVGLAPDASPSEVATAVDRAIARAKRAKVALPEPDAHALGVLWGKAVAYAAGWSWAVVVDGDDSYLSVVSKDLALACPVLVYMAEQAKPGSETTALLLFNMIVGGNVPEAKPGQLSFMM
jgi:hypothetical protein